MTKIALSLGCIDFIDRTRSLFDGEVGVEGVDLTCVALSPTDVFTRVPRFAEFDVGEVSMGAYLDLLSEGDDRFVGIPAFTVRAFLAGNIYVHGAAGIEGPRDLAGKRVGIPDFYTTAVIWIRGILREFHGVDDRQIQWYTGGSDNAFYRSRPEGLRVPENVKNVRVIEPEQTLSLLLAEGAIDAWIGAGRPSCVESGSKNVHRLFPQFRELDRQMASERALFPILHLFLLKRETYERHPWLARNVFEALARAKQKGASRLLNGGAYACCLPWLPDDVGDLQALMGQDYFPYGVQRNRATLGTLLDYAADQRIIPSDFTVDSLFSAEVRDT